MSRTTQPTIDIRHADTRFATDAGWLTSRHCFSFARHYDAANTHHGLLLVSNDDIVAPHTGFDTHPHQDMEIVTWVLSGELENNTSEAPVHFIQMWVLPDAEGVDPGYQQLDINPELDRGGLVPIASGRGHEAAIAIRQYGAVLWGGRLKPGETVSVPDGQFVHVYVAGGGAQLENAGYLDTGDAARLTAAGAPKLTAHPTEGAQVLIWQTELPLHN
jgi:redox-sensitive bicupin YhaK (pirin superfamily)